MTTTTIGRRGKDIVVGYSGTTFVTRAQSFQVIKDIPTTNAYELGTTEATGAFQDSTRYRGTLTRFSVDAALETAFGGGTADLESMIEADGISIICAQFGISDAKFTSVAYTGRTDGWAQEVWSFIGSTGSTGSVTATTPVAGAAGSRHPKMSFAVNSVTGVRAQGYSIRAAARGNELSELNNATIVGTVYDQPTIDIDLDWVSSGSIAGNTELSLGSSGSIVVTLKDESDTTTKIITIQSCITDGTTDNATVAGWATESISYSSLCNTIDAGLTVTTS